MEAQNYVKHVILWSLSAFQKSFENIGKIQVDDKLTDEQKKEITNGHQLFILSLAYLLKPYLTEAKELYPNQTPLFDWIAARYEEAINANAITNCQCLGCKSE